MPMPEQPVHLWIDPGGKHAGVAQFTRRDDGKWYCFSVMQCEPREAEDYVARLLVRGKRQLDVLGIEQFNLYPDKMEEQIGSTMPTCENIGVLKFLHRVNQEHAAGHPLKRGEIGVCGDARCPGAESVELILQPAAIQTPTASLLRSRGIKSLARQTGATPHGLSAELHGYHYLIRTLKAEIYTGNRPS